MHRLTITYRDGSCKDLTCRRWELEGDVLYFRAMSGFNLNVAGVQQVVSH